VGYDIMTWWRSTSEYEQRHAIELAATARHSFPVCGGFDGHAPKPVVERCGLYVSDDIFGADIRA
jgi:hypothetical protein